MRAPGHSPGRSLVRDVHGGETPGTAHVDRPIHSPVLSDEAAHPAAAVRLHAYALPVALACATAGFMLAYYATKLIGSAYGGVVPEDVVAVLTLFDLNRESSVPTWFNSLLWIFAAWLALAASQESRADRRRWRLLAVLFAFLSLDESGEVHERIGDVLGTYVHLSGPFFYVWVLYGLVFLIAVAAFFGPFILSLPPRVRTLIGYAAAVFVSGALGIEMLSAAVESAGTDFVLGLTWTAAIALEEGLEMFGVIILIHALLVFLGNHTRSRMFSFVVDS
jgi:hypothetical protein